MKEAWNVTQHAGIYEKEGAVSERYLRTGWIKKQRFNKLSLDNLLKFLALRF